MGSMQSYGAVYTYCQKIKRAAHKNGDVDGTRKRALSLCFTVTSLNVHSLFKVTPLFFVFFTMNISNKNLKDIRRCWYHCSELLVTSTPGFKIRVDPSTCMFCNLHTRDFSDSPLLQLLLISWQSVWRPTNFSPVTFSTMELEPMPSIKTFVKVNNTHGFDFLD